MISDGTGSFPLDSMRTLWSGYHVYGPGDIGDVERDGDYDIMFSYAGYDHGEDNARIFINNGTGNFTEDSEARLPGYWTGEMESIL